MLYFNLSSVALKATKGHLGTKGQNDKIPQVLCFQYKLQGVTPGIKSVQMTGNTDTDMYLQQEHCCFLRTDHLEGSPEPFGPWPFVYFRESATESTTGEGGGCPLLLAFGRQGFFVTSFWR